MNKTILLLSLPLATAIMPPVSAQFGASKIASATAAALPAAVARGGKGALRVTLTVKPAYHVNANKPNDPAYIPTDFSVSPLTGFSFGAVRYPTAQTVKVSYSPKPLLVYRGRVTITIPFTVTPAAHPGAHLLVGTVSYQGCDAKSCYPPTSESVKAAVTVR